tara:strand:- start:12322 stop:15237 length:2916 start_codon:yes stop_codon:yes gene_type:complete
LNFCFKTFNSSKIIAFILCGVILVSCKPPEGEEEVFFSDENTRAASNKRNRLKNIIPPGEKAHPEAKKFINCVNSQVSDYADEDVFSKSKILDIIFGEVEKTVAEIEQGKKLSRSLCHNKGDELIDWVGPYLRLNGYEIEKEYLYSFPEKLRVDCGKVLKKSAPKSDSNQIKRSIKRYYKCYQQFTMNRLSQSDARLERVKNGEISGVDACMELFDLASLSGSETSATWQMVNAESNEGQKVLKTFNDLHRSWFTSILFPEHNSSFHTEDLLENGEPGLFYTRSLFASEVGYEDILKGHDVLGGIRETSSAELNHGDHTGHIGYYYKGTVNRRNIYGTAGYSFSRDILNSNGWVSANNHTNRWKVNDGSPGEDSSRDYIKSKAPLVENGTFKGIKNRSLEFQDDPQLRNYCGMYSSTYPFGYPYNGYGGLSTPLLKATKQRVVEGEIVATPLESATFTPFTSIREGYGFNVRIGETGPIDLFRSAGGGAMGSHAFVLQNMDITFPKVMANNLKGSAKNRHRVVSDGSVKIQRRWAKRVLSDFLCREVPVINYDDLETVYEDTSSSIPFRKSASCMTCHATMDQMAMTARNVVIEKTAHHNALRFPFPTLKPSELCISTKWETVEKWEEEDGVEKWVEKYHEKTKHIFHLKTASGEELPEGIHYSKCQEKSFISGHRAEPTKKGFWPNSGDTWDQRSLCHKNEDPKTMVNPIFTEESEFKWSEEPVANYHLTKPTGKFLFREFDSPVGESVIDADVVGVNELAGVVRNTSDFYACGAKRYLEYLTGIKLAMTAESLTTNLNPTEKNHRKVIRCLGEDLRDSDNPRETIRKIIASDLYLNANSLDVIDDSSSDVDLVEIENSASIEKVTGILSKEIYGCTGCHTGIDNWDEEDFLNSKLPFHASELGISVNAGDPCGSSLFTSLRGKDKALSELSFENDICDSFGGNMPQSSLEELTRDEILTIYFWIKNLSD